MSPRQQTKVARLKSLSTLLIGLLLNLPLAPTGRAAKITVKGSDTLVILAQKWAEVYMSEHPDTKVQVTGGGSETGFAALQNQTTDLVNASRKIRASECASCIKVFRKRPTEYRVCLDGLSIYVHDENPVTELSLKQLGLIFTGRIRNWKTLDGPNAPITIYSRENSSGTYAFFKKNVLLEKDFTATAQSMPGTAAVLQAVAKDRYGIGYGGAAYGINAKSLRIKRTTDSPAYPPTEHHVRNRNYPIWRYLYIYANPNQDHGAIADYLQWIQSKKGQAVVRDVGYFPLPACEQSWSRPQTPKRISSTGLLDPSEQLRSSRGGWGGRDTVEPDVPLPSTHAGPGQQRLASFFSNRNRHS
ncbi:MAG: Phosphate-binding protein PstS [Verrucomicrobia subdivision 3 bacterium]|nr:Phosphate-binding protein PstS [Limisphaerales bacterium]MCS1414742.1 Phosphate-binding protein PstS [Limisphaerales bacterium]